MNSGRSGTALLWTGSYALPNGIEIGTGSSAKTSSTTTLTTPVIFRVFASGGVDVSTPQQVTFTADFTSTELSGLTIRELAVKESGGTYWSADGFPGVTFNGNVEMQVIVTWEIF